MNPGILFSFVIGYFILLLVVAWYTSRNSNNESFFIGNRSSNWMLVSFGMIGTSLSGVTFVSVPGTVGNFTAAGNTYKAFSYFQVVLGYLVGYFIIAYVLLPLYYKRNLTSIYNYLQQRFGNFSYKTGALFFIISRTVGATARLFLVINVLQIFILDKMGVPFIVTALIILLMILLYTFEGGVKTIVYTDTLQTTFMLLGLVVCVVYILNHMDMSFSSALQVLNEKGYARIFDTNVNSKSFFVKDFIGGIFIAVAMTGLDQEMMQKNISVKTLRGSQKNIITFSAIIAIVNFLFLLLGGLLYLFMINKGYGYEGKQFLVNGSNMIGDDLFPTVALNFLPQAVSVIFIIALISALFPSADGALTALTSSFCIDMLGLKRRSDWDEKTKKRIRMTVHLTLAIIFLICILIFKWINQKSIIGIILDLAGYTYGPLLGLFSFGILTKRQINDGFAVTLICLAAPCISYFISKFSGSFLGGYKIGIELLLINGFFTFIGLWMISKNQNKIAQ
ncbi:MAG TPA: sodium:solute symporter [Chitinophagaceae bacterium]|nr:sodium:solute symporter [Chitinophagaceae bacterium]